MRPPPPRDPARRAVVTGLGAITPIGNDVATFWRNLTDGVSGVAPITLFDASDYEVRIAAEVKDFEPRDWMDFKQARRMSRFSQLAVAAARQAIDDAGLEIGAAQPGRRRRRHEHRWRRPRGGRRRRGDAHDEGAATASARSWCR